MKVFKQMRSNGSEYSKLTVLFRNSDELFH